MTDMREELDRARALRDQLHYDYLCSRTARDRARLRADESLKAHRKVLESRKQAERSCDSRWREYRLANRRVDLILQAMQYDDPSLLPALPDELAAVMENE